MKGNTNLFFETDNKEKWACKMQIGYIELMRFESDNILVRYKIIFLCY
jgi:hypothetical protein